MEEGKDVSNSRTSRNSNSKSKSVDQDMSPCTTDNDVLITVDDDFTGFKRFEVVTRGDMLKQSQTLVELSKHMEKRSLVQSKSLVFNDIIRGGNVKTKPIKFKANRLSNGKVNLKSKSPNNQDLVVIGKETTFEDGLM